MLVDDLTLIKPLGKGAFGEVYLTSKQGSSKKFATKKIDKKFTANPKAKKYLDNEIGILRDIDHPNIVKLYDVKETSQFYYLVTEFCNGGGLSDCLEQYQEKHNKAFPEEIVQYLMKQIVSALRYLHNKTILHRDIKLDNILVHFENEEDRRNKNMLKAKVKMIDFGFARYLKKEELAYSTLGSPINMDPGILRKLNKMSHSNEYGYDAKADIWSLGTITYELLVGSPAFEATSYQDLFQKIEKGNYRIPHDLTVSKEAISFLNSMLRYDPKSRYSVEQLSKQFFLTRDPSTFHSVQLKKSNMDFKQSIILNSKEDKNSNIYNMWSMYKNNDDFSQYNPEETTDNKPFSQPGKPQKIKNEPKDVVGNELQKHIIDDSYKKTGQNNINNIKEKIDSSMSDYLQNIFDEMNKDCFYIEPLLIPTQPSDGLNSVDPISKFMDTL